MENTKTCCYMCPKRKIGCHGTCPDYQKYHESRIELSRKNRMKQLGFKEGLWIINNYTQKRKMLKSEY